RRARPRRTAGNDRQRRHHRPRRRSSARTHPMTEVTEKRGWLSRLKAGLDRTSSRLSEGISHALRARKLDDAALAEIEDALIGADLRPVAAARLTDGLRSARFMGEIAEQQAREKLAADIAAILLPVAPPQATRPEPTPHLLLE